METPDSELILLERIREAEGEANHLTQRKLARASGLSLGMTNALIRRLAERGWLSLTRLSTKSFRYALTPEGVAEITRRTVSYVRRSSRSANLYEERIESFVMAAKRSGVETLVLVGPSEADFVLEHACERHDLVFVKSADCERARNLARRPGVALVWSEHVVDGFSSPGQIELSLGEITTERQG